MKLNCTIDGTQQSMIVNANKPLNRILEELSDTFVRNHGCLDAGCGNCIVLINGAARLSCLIPAFRVNGAAILTYAGFRKTRFCHDIERAYAETGVKPCAQCYASKTILIGGILNRYDQTRASSMIKGEGENKANYSIYSREYLEREMNINVCKCTDIDDIAKVVELAYTYRRQRSGS